jgi:hypothetical protein
MTLEEEAKDNGLGLHLKGADPMEHVRNIDFNPDAVKLFSKFRGTPVPGTHTSMSELCCR